MPHRTPEQHAKRLNKAIDKRYPLVGEHFHTTPEEQARRLQKIDKGIVKWQEQIADFHRTCYDHAAHSIYLLIDHLGEEQVNEIAKQREQQEQRWPTLTQSVYLSDFWYNQVRKYYQTG